MINLTEVQQCHPNYRARPALILCSTIPTCHRWHTCGALTTNLPKFLYTNVEVVLYRPKFRTTISHKSLFVEVEWGVWQKERVFVDIASMMQMDPQISSQVLIANTFPSVAAEATIDSRLACNFGFLDSWSSPGRSYIMPPTTKTERWLQRDAHLRSGELGTWFQVSTSPEVQWFGEKGKLTRPLRLKTIFRSQGCSAMRRTPQAGADCRHCSSDSRIPGHRKINTIMRISLSKWLDCEWANLLRSLFIYVIHLRPSQLPGWLN